MFLEKLIPSRYLQCIDISNQLCLLNSSNLFLRILFSSVLLHGLPFCSSRAIDWGLGFEMERLFPEGSVIVFFNALYIFRPIN